MPVILPDLTDALFSYPKVSRDTFLAPTATFQGQRVIPINLKAPFPKMATHISNNFGKLCHKTLVNESLINALYSNGVIDSKVQEDLV
jgi:hypothetical protein